MWFFDNKKKKEKQLEKENEEKLIIEKRKKKFDEIEQFAKIGEYIKYLGVKMLVVNYHTYTPDSFSWSYEPSLNVEYMDKNNIIQKARFDNNDLKFIKKVKRS
jgi:hypothetical protein